MSEEETKILLLGGKEDDSDVKTRKKPTISTKQTENDVDDDSDESTTPRRRKSSRDRKSKKKAKKSGGKKKDDASSGDENTSKEDARATLSSLASEVEEHRVQIAKLEQRITEIARANGIDPSEYIKCKSDVIGAQGSKCDITVTPPAETRKGESENSDDDAMDGVTDENSPEDSNNGDDDDFSNNINSQQTSIYKAQKISKLERLTGRRDSLSKIQPFLMADTPDEAMKNAQMLWSSDHLKRMYGSRPVLSDKTESAPSKHRGQHRASKSSITAVMASKVLEKNATRSTDPTTTTGELAALNIEGSSSSSSATTTTTTAAQDESKRTSKMSVTPTGLVSESAKNHEIVAGGDDIPRRRRSSSCGSNSEGSGDHVMVGGASGGGGGAAAGLVINKKVDKLNKLTGRRDSISEIVELLDPKTPDEARECAKSLYSMEAIKRKFGSRTAVVVPRKGKEGMKDENNNNNNSNNDNNNSNNNNNNNIHHNRNDSSPVGTSCESDLATTLSTDEKKDE